MLGFLLRIVLFLVAVRFVGGLVRMLAGGGERSPSVPKPPAPPKPIVDRSSAIDVPFTEEHTEP